MTKEEKNQMLKGVNADNGSTKERLHELDQIIYDIYDKRRMEIQSASDTILMYQTCMEIFKRYSL